MPMSLDRSLPVPLRAQLRGLIQYGIACGELAPGARLPSVRDMAGDVGVAPMTVAQVYRDLKADGLLETRAGSGTFVARRRVHPLPDEDRVAAFQRRLDALIDDALGIGLAAGEIAGLIGARLSARSPTRAATRPLAMVGLFPAATEGYARIIAEALGPGTIVDPVTIDVLRASAPARRRAAEAALVLTFAYLRRDILGLLPDRTVVALSFIPSEATRRALASIDPRARVLVVSRLPEFLAFMKAGVQRFAPHVGSIEASPLEDGRVDALAAESDVVVLSTGSEALRDRLPPGVVSVDYAHVPDPGDIERIVRPLLRAARSDGRAPPAIPAAPAPNRKAS